MIETLSIEQVCERLGCKRRRVFQLLKDGTLERAPRFGRSLRIYGASQRPASIDKHFFGNATQIRTGRLNFARDVKVLADVLQVPAMQVQGLQPLDWIARDMANGKISTGKLTPPR